MAQLTALQLYQAGFSEDQILGFINDQRQALKAAGFTDIEINTHYGIGQTHSSAIKPEHLSPNVENTYLQHNELGKMDQVTKKNEKEKLLDDKNVIAKNAFNNEKMLFKNFAIEDQRNIFEMAMTANKLFKDDEDGRLGFMDSWLSTAYPSLDVTNKDFISDLTVVESALNDIYKGKKDKDFHARSLKNKMLIGEYQVDVAKKESELIKKRKEVESQNPKVLHTTATTGANTYHFLQFMKQEYEANDFQMIWFNEAVSFISAIESDNRNIINPDPNSSASGFWQMTKATMKTALTAYARNMQKHNSNWQVPEWMELASEHLDMTKLDPDQQRALVIANLYNRKGTDELIKQIMTGDKEQQLNALKELYKTHHYAGKVSKELEERIEKYFNSWGTPDYAYMHGQLAFWPSTNEDGFNNPFGNDKEFLKESWKFMTDIPYYAAEAAEKLGIPLNRGHYTVFTNGYTLSVNGFIDKFHQILNEDPNISVQEAYQKVFMWQEQSFGREIASGFVTIANDFPWMVAGCVGANVAASGIYAASGGTGLVASPIVCGAGAFALPEVIRDSYMRAIDAGEVDNFNDFLKHFFTLKTAWTGTKSAAVGGATLGVGSKVTKVIGPKLGAGTIGEKGAYLASKDASMLAKSGTLTARVGSEVVTMVTLQSLLNGHVPTKKDFAHAAVMIFGIHATVKVGSNAMGTMKGIYKRFGIHPKNIVELTKNNPDAANKLANGIVPDEVNALATQLMKKAEETTNKKVLPISKYKNNEKVTTNNGEEVIVVGKEVQNGESVLIVKQPNGLKVPILEAEVRKINNENIEIKVNKNKKIEVNETVDKDFVKRQENGEFSKDIVEVTKDETGIHIKDFDGTINKSTPLQAVNDVGGKIKITSVDNKASANPSMLVINKYYPKLAKVIQSSKETRSEGKFKTSKDIIDHVFKGLDKSYKKISIVFGIKKGELVDADTLVGRIGKEYVSFSRKAYNELIKFTDVDGKVKNAKLVASDPSKPIVFIHPKSSEPMGILMTRKIDGELKTQAHTYFRNHKIKEDMDGMHYDRVNSTRDGNNFEVPLDEYTSSKAEQGYKDVAWKRIYNNAKGIDLDSMVDLVEIFIKKSPEIKNLPKLLRGFFQFKGKNAPRVVIARKLQEMPEKLYMVLAHEIGHMIDFLPNKTLARGNILGSMATLKKFMNEWIDGKNDGARPLDTKEINALKKKANEIAKKLEKETNKEIGELKITPETILKIFNDAKAREKIPPEFYDAFVKLGESIKKQVVKDAMKGLMSHHMKAIADKINGKKVDPKLSDEALKIFQELFQKEIKERGLVNKEWIMQELKSLSHKWKPFNPKNDPAYTKYRYSPRELFADFMMAWLLKPQWVALNMPKSFELWVNFIERKPALKKLYEDIQIDLNAGKETKIAKIIAKTTKEFRDANETIMDKIKNLFQKDYVDMFHAEVFDTMGFFFRRNNAMKGWYSRWHSEQAKDLNIAIERFRYRHSQLKRYADDMIHFVLDPILNKGHNINEFGTGLFLRNLYESGQRKNVITRRFFKLDEKVEAELLKKFEGQSIEAVWEYWAKQYPDLIPLMDKFYEIRQAKIIAELEKSQTLPQETIDLMKSNHQYITHDVVKHLLKRLQKHGINKIATSFIGKTQGTFSMIRNPFEATVEKDMILLSEAKKHVILREMVGWLKQNKEVFETYEFLGQGNKASKLIDKMEKKFLLPKDQKGRIIVKPTKQQLRLKTNPPEGMEQISYFDKGELTTYWVNKQATRMFRENPWQIRIISTVMTNLTGPFKKLFTEYNPAFWPVNFSRDSFNTIRLLPNARFFDFKNGGKNSWLKYLTKGFIPTIKSVYGRGTKFTRWTEEQNMLIDITEGHRGQAGEAAARRFMDAEQYQLELFLKKFRSNKMTLKTRFNKKEGTWETKQGTIMELWHEIFGDNGLFGHLGLMARVAERWPKVSGAMYLRDAIKRGDLKMDVGEMMIKVQEDIGSPSFLRQGGGNMILNTGLIYSNAMKEGWRREFSAFREQPFAYMGKFFFYSLVPKITMKAMQMGAFGTPLALLYLGVKQYDMNNYIVVPFGTTHDGRTVYLRIPQDETARMLSSLFYQGMSTALDDENIVGKKEPWTAMLNYLAGNFPQKAPWLDLIGQVLGWSNGVTPHDDWSGQKAVPPTIEAMKHLDDNSVYNKEILKWFINSYTGQGFYKFKTYEDTVEMAGVQKELETILGFPIVGTVLGRFIKIGNHAGSANLHSASTAYDAYSAKVTYNAKMAMAKILNDKAHEITDIETKALAERLPSWANNNSMIETIIKLKGGNQILQQIVGEHDIKKRVWLTMKFVNWARKVGIDVPE
jgi:hypothetical protein